MSTMVILNVVLAIFIVAAILSLLLWGIVTDRDHGGPPFTTRAQRLAAKAARSLHKPPGRVLDLSA